jgi:nucleotide-binding universal stress UspA family protein
MTYRSLLVHLDREPTCAPRTLAAAQLAGALGARLVGIAPTGQLDVQAVPAVVQVIGDLAPVMWQALSDQAADAVEAFRRGCADVGLTDCEATVRRGAHGPLLLQRARYHDLVVLSQPDPRDASHARLRALIEDVLMASPKPVLFIPYAAHLSGRFDTVVVAWDGSRESTRAITDALPLLRQAKQVHVASWSEPNDATENEKESAASLADVQDWLRSHDVSATIHREGRPDGITESILSRAFDWGADLIVMGAYGHSRLQERVLGGATRGMLDSMTVPVLMSH